jgi:hypothetical protein
MKILAFVSITLPLRQITLFSLTFKFTNKTPEEPFITSIQAAFIGLY